METNIQASHLSSSLGAAQSLSEEEHRRNKARYDQYAKELIADKQVLARLLQHVVREFEGMAVEDIIGCIEDVKIGTEQLMPGAINGLNTENNIPNEGTVTFDVFFHAMAPGEREPLKIFINVEAQNSFYPGYRLESRGVFYAARMLSRQLDREFDSSDYGKMKKVYSIWLCFDTPGEARHSITEYTLQPRHIYGKYGKAEYCDYISVIMLCLDKDEMEFQDNAILDLLTILFSDRQTAAGKENILSDRYGMIMEREGKERLTTMCNLSEGVELRGYRNGIEKGERIGLEKGEQIGLEKGLEKGEQAGAMKAYRRMLEKGMPVSEAREYVPELTAENALQIEKELGLA